MIELSVHKTFYTTKVHVYASEKIIKVENFLFSILEEIGL